MTQREGNLEAPRRQPIDWQSDDFYDKDSLEKEMERVFDVCHGCRRCVSLCNAFPTLFDLVDESDTFEVDGVDKNDYRKVVDECYLCDLCAETKCPYLPPHSWAIDFPHLMLRAKAHKFKTEKTPVRDRLIASTDAMFGSASTTGIAPIANAIASSKPLRSLGESWFGVHREAPIPYFDSKGKRTIKSLVSVSPSTSTRAQEQQSVAIYVTCYGQANEPGVVASLIKVLQHNDVDVNLLPNTSCCGMPKLELGDLDAVAKLKERNFPTFLQAVAEGRKIMSVIPSCTLMYRQEIPLLFPDDEEVEQVKNAFVDPFEFLLNLHKQELLNTDFQNSLGQVAYHAACHQRIQNIGQKTREFLSLIPDSEVSMIERCSGHDGTYAVKKETYDSAMKIARPVIRQVSAAEPDTYGSDCPMAGRLIAHGLSDGSSSEHPLTMVARAYGIDLP